MTKDEQQTIDDLANALQTAAPLSTALRQQVLTLEAAIARAVTAITRLQPKGGRHEQA